MCFAKSPVARIGRIGLTGAEYVQLRALNDEIIQETEANDELESLIRAEKAELRKLELHSEVFALQEKIDSTERRSTLFQVDEQAFLSDFAVSELHELQKQLALAKNEYFTAAELVTILQDVKLLENKLVTAERTAEENKHAYEQTLADLVAKREHLMREITFLERVTPQNPQSEVEKTPEAEGAMLLTKELQDLQEREQILLQANLYKKHLEAVDQANFRAHALREEILRHIRAHRMGNTEFEVYKSTIAAKMQDLALSVDKSDFLEDEMLELCAVSYSKAISNSSVLDSPGLHLLSEPPK